MIVEKEAIEMMVANPGAAAQNCYLLFEEVHALLFRNVFACVRERV